MTLSGAVGVASSVAAFLAAAGMARPIDAQGHGPVYGLSTPTLGEGAWSLDVAVMGRWLEDEEGAMVRPMVSHGLTEDVQLSISFPLVLTPASSAPPVRGFTRMSATKDAEVMLGWRFQRKGMGVGARRETTLWLAWDEPLGGDRDGGSRSRSLFGALATGYASRAVYLWLGAGYGYGRGLPGSGASATGNGDVAMGSLVFGYRPPAFRGEYPSADWRAFLELVGERRGRNSGGASGADLGAGRQVFAALTFLGLYGSWGVAGGPAVPLYQDRSAGVPAERMRLAVNGIVWF